MLSNTNKKQIVVGLLFIFTEHLKLNEMKTKEVQRKDLVVGGEYYDTSTDGQKMFYLGILVGEEGCKFMFFYSSEDHGYETDSDGKIPFGVEGSPFYEQID